MKLNFTLYLYRTFHIVLILFIGGCIGSSQDGCSPCDDCMNVAHTDDKNWYRDSLVIQYAIHSFITDRIYAYSAFTDPTMDSNQSYIGEVMVSPDKHKMLAYVAVKCYYNDNSWSNVIAGEKIQYEGRIIFGYRNNANAIWRIYPFTQWIAGSYSTCSGVFVAIDEYLNNSFPERGENIIQSDDSEIYIKYQYSPSSLMFWDSCLIWKIVNDEFVYENIALRGLQPFSDKLTSPSPPLVTFPNRIRKLFQ